MTLATPAPATRPSTFVHDFVPLTASLIDTALRLRGALAPQLLRVDLAGACNREASPALTMIGHHASVSPEEVSIRLGRDRSRDDALIVPIGFVIEPIAGVPITMEADVEVASYGLDRCHLHLLGRAELPAAISPMSPQASLYGRLVVAVVRHMLEAVAARLLHDR